MHVYKVEVQQRKMKSKLTLQSMETSPIATVLLVSKLTCVHVHVLRRMLSDINDARTAAVVAGFGTII